MSSPRKKEGEIRRAVHDYLCATGLNLLDICNLEGRVALSKWLEHAPTTVQLDVKETLGRVQGWVTLIDVPTELTPEIEDARRNLLEVLQQ